MGQRIILCFIFLCITNVWIYNTKCFGKYSTCLINVPAAFAYTRKPYGKAHPGKNDNLTNSTNNISLPTVNNSQLPCLQCASPSDCKRSLGAMITRLQRLKSTACDWQQNRKTIQMLNKVVVLVILGLERHESEYFNDRIVIFGWTNPLGRRYQLMATRWQCFCLYLFSWNWRE